MRWWKQTAGAWKGNPLWATSEDVVEWVSGASRRRSRSVGQIADDVGTLLDTTFIVDHLRGMPEAVQRLRRIVEQGDMPFVNDVVTAEAWAGAPSDDDASPDEPARV